MRQGWEVDVKRVYCLYKAEGLMVRRLRRKRLSRSVPSNPSLVRPNQEWAMDFVSDALATGRALRTFTLIDSFTKESPAIEVNTGISSRQVARVLERIIEERGTRAQFGATTGRNLPACSSWSGARIAASRWFTFNPASRCRTVMWGWRSG
jgi:putative transposase